MNSFCSGTSAITVACENISFRGLPGIFPSFWDLTQRRLVKNWPTLRNIPEDGRIHCGFILQFDFARVSVISSQFVSDWSAIAGLFSVSNALSLYLLPHSINTVALQRRRFESLIRDLWHLLSTCGGLKHRWFVATTKASPQKTFIFNITRT